VYAGEVARVQLPLQRLDRLAHEVAAAGRVDPGVVVRGLDPVHVLDLQHRHPAVVLHEQSVGVLLTGSELRQDGVEPLIERLRASLAEPRPSATERDSKTVLVEGLEQVVHGVHIERANRVLVVGGHEHDDGQRFSLERLQHAEPIELRHLDIEKHEIGSLSADDIHRLGTVARLPHEREACRRSDERPKPAPHERLVVGDDDADVSHRGRQRYARCGGSRQLRRRVRPVVRRRLEWNPDAGDAPAYRKILQRELLLLTVQSLEACLAWW
jgi:hypothetical protein